MEPRMEWAFRRDAAQLARERENGEKGVKGERLEEGRRREDDRKVAGGVGS